jgi:integrase
MKMSKDHRVPLTPRMLVVLDGVRPLGSDLVFPSLRGGVMSDMTLSALIRRMGIEGVTLHGFRSSFRDWAGEATSFPREIAEAALAHAVGDAAEQAYRRGDALERRRPMMAAWEAYIEGVPAGGVVIPMVRATA